MLHLKKCLLLFFHDFRRCSRCPIHKNRSKSWKNQNPWPTRHFSKILRNSRVGQGFRFFHDFRRFSRCPVHKNRSKSFLWRLETRDRSTLETGAFCLLTSDFCKESEILNPIGKSLLLLLLFFANPCFCFLQIPASKMANPCFCFLQIPALRGRIPAFDLLNPWFLLISPSSWEDRLCLWMARTSEPWLNT